MFEVISFFSLVQFWMLQMSKYEIKPNEMFRQFSVNVMTELSPHKSEQTNVRLPPSNGLAPQSWSWSCCSIGCWQHKAVLPLLLCLQGLCLRAPRSPAWCSHLRLQTDGGPPALVPVVLGEWGQSSSFKHKHRKGGRFCFRPGLFCQCLLATQLDAIYSFTFIRAAFDPWAEKLFCCQQGMKKWMLGVCDQM